VYPDMLAFNPDIVLLCGDNCSKLASSYESFLNTCKDLFASAILISAIGNHEWGDGYDVWREYYYFPQDGPEPEIDYAVTYGGVMVFAMRNPSTALNTSAAAKVSAGRQAGVNFVFFAKHYPSYGISNGNRIFYHIHSYLAELFDQVQADIEFNGHWHLYLRTFPIQLNPYRSDLPGLVFTNDKKNYNANTKGTIYHIVRSMDYQFIEHTPSLHFAAGSDTADRVGYNEVVFDGKKCTVSSYMYAYGTNQRVLEDQYVIDKNDSIIPPAPDISNIQADNINGYSAQIKWATDIEALGYVEFGTIQGEYPFISSRKDAEQVWGKTHKAHLFGLNPNTIYYYRIKSWRQGAESKSRELSFITTSENSGVLAGYFSFQPSTFAAPDSMASAVHQSYDDSSRQGWTSGYSSGMSCYGVMNESDFKNKSYYRHPNSYQPAKWQFDLANGAYRIEAGTGMAGDGIQGETKIDLENGQLILSETEANLNNSLVTLQGEINITDGRLNLALGTNTSVGKYSTINYIKIIKPGAVTSNPFTRIIYGAENYLLSPYPCPAKASVYIHFALVNPRNAHLGIFNIHGVLVKNLFPGDERDGHRISAIWKLDDNKGRSVPAGTYFVELKNPKNRFIEKIQILR
ncbi:MAG: fibronectin type III domain-containing protein, partial [bacterium]